MALRDTRDTWWTPAPLTYPDSSEKVKVALFSHLDGYTPDPSVAQALQQAAKSLTDAGYVVEERVLPNFAEGQDLWSKLVMNEARKGFAKAVMTVGDAKVRKEVLAWLEITPEVDLEGFSKALGRREDIGLAWNELLEEFPVILMPNSWEAPFVHDRDQGGPDGMRKVLHTQSPMLLPALLGLPGLSVPTGVYNGIPGGVQLVANRYREDRCFAVGEVIEQALPMPTPIDPRF